jgi:hypothetical protein
LAFTVDFANSDEMEVRKFLDLTRPCPSISPLDLLDATFGIREMLAPLADVFRLGSPVDICFGADFAGEGVGVDAQEVDADDAEDVSMSNGVLTKAHPTEPVTSSPCSKLSFVADIIIPGASTVAYSFCFSDPVPSRSKC